MGGGMGGEGSKSAGMKAGSGAVAGSEVAYVDREVRAGDGEGRSEAQEVRGEEAGGATRKRGREGEAGEGATAGSRSGAAHAGGLSPNARHERDGKGKMQRRDEKRNKYANKRDAQARAREREPT